MVGWLVRWHRAILACAGVLAILSVIALWRPGLSDDFSLRTVAGSSDEEFHKLERFIEQYAGVELALIVVQTNEFTETADEMMSEASQACLAQIVEEAEELEAVDGVTCISQVSDLFRGMVARSPIARGLLVSEDGTAATVLLQMKDDSAVADTPRATTVKALKDIVARAQADHKDHRVVLTGPYVLSYEMTHLVYRDLFTFGLFGAVASLAVLSVSLGTVRLALYPLVVGLVTVALALGLSVVLDINTALNLPMMVLLTAVLTMANCVHLAVGHDEEAGDAGATVRRLVWPCTGVVATTVVGFSAVGLSELEPVRSFALLMGLGLSIGLLLSLAAASGVLTTHSSDGLLSRPISWLLHVALRTTLTCPKAIVATFAVVGIGALLLISQLQFNLNFLDNFRPDDEIRKNYEFVENTLSPMQSIELLISRKDVANQTGDEKLTALTPKAVKAMQKLKQEFEPNPTIARSMSIADFFAFSDPSLPDSEAVLRSQWMALDMFLGSMDCKDLLTTFISPDESMLRISFLAHEGLNAEDKIAQGNQMRDRAQELLGDEYEVEVTGLYYFYAHVARELMRDQIVLFAGEFDWRVFDHGGCAEEFSCRLRGNGSDSVRRCHVRWPDGALSRSLQQRHLHDVGCRLGNCRGRHDSLPVAVPRESPARFVAAAGDYSHAIDSRPGVHADKSGNCGGIRRHGFLPVSANRLFWPRD